MRGNIIMIKDVVHYSNCMLKWFVVKRSVNKTWMKTTQPWEKPTNVLGLIWIPGGSNDDWTTHNRRSGNFRPFSSRQPKHKHKQVWMCCRTHRRTGGDEESCMCERCVFSLTGCKWILMLSSSRTWHWWREYSHHWFSGEMGWLGGPSVNECDRLYQWDNL